MRLACRWLLPWAIILAISACIAHAAAAMLAPALTIETGTRVTADEQSAPAEDNKRPTWFMVQSAETSSAMTRVSCPSEPDVITDVQIVSLQDLDLLMASQCAIGAPQDARTR
jgi:hypothetical protein